MVRLRGGEPTLGDAVRLAAVRARPIFGWAVVVLAVGAALSRIGPSFGVTRIAGVAWSVATFLAAPVLVVEGVEPLDALRRSLTLVRVGWRQQVASRFAILVPALVLAFPGVVALIVFLFAPSDVALPALGACLAYLLAVATLYTTLESVLAAALYVYATDGAIAPPFGSDLLAGAVRR